MDFRQLEALKLISDTGSFSETAHRLGVTQPTVSSQISALEREFGCRLLTRHPGGAAPTETGAALYKYAAEILSLKDKAIAACGQRRPEMSATLGIAASSIPFQFVLPILTAQFSMKYPQAKFDIMGGNSKSAAGLVLSGGADLAMLGAIIPHDDLLYEAVLEDELVAITPVKSPYTEWSHGYAVTGDILSVPFVAREEGSGTWAEVARYMEKQGYDEGALRIAARIDNPDVIMKSVEQGMGITILSSLAANEYRRKGNILIFSLAGEPVKRKIYLARVRGREMPALGKAFRRFVSDSNYGFFP